MDLDFRKTTIKYIRYMRIHSSEHQKLQKETRSNVKIVQLVERDNETLF